MADHCAGPSVVSESVDSPVVVWVSVPAVSVSGYLVHSEIVCGATMFWRLVKSICDGKLGDVVGHLLWIVCAMCAFGLAGVGSMKTPRKHVSLDIVFGPSARLPLIERGCSRAGVHAVKKFLAKVHHGWNPRGSMTQK